MIPEHQSSPTRSADSCSALARSAGEPLAGTAPVAAAWVVIEQPGSWGAKALQDAALPDGIGPAIASAAAAAGVGVLLARHPERTLRAGRIQAHRVWVADVRPGSQRLATGSVGSVAEVADWDFAAIVDGALPTGQGPMQGEPVGLGPSPAPLLLVCTQGGRDACCAVIGRSLLIELTQGLQPDRRVQVWEASHIGGHRFAPTVLALPTGAVYGRLDATAAGEVLEATARLQVRTGGLRGCTALPPPAQVADIAIRERTGEIEVAALHAEAVYQDAGTASVLVAHRDKRTWLVRLRQEPLAVPRPQSCGGRPEPGLAWAVSSIEEGDYA